MSIPIQALQAISPYCTIYVKKKEDDPIVMYAILQKKKEHVQVRKEILGVGDVLDKKWEMTEVAVLHVTTETDEGKETHSFYYPLNHVSIGLEMWKED